MKRNTEKTRSACAHDRQNMKGRSETKKPFVEVVVNRFVSAARLNIRGPLLGNAAFLAREEGERGTKRKRERER